jgi:hypothetical protein
MAKVLHASTGARNAAVDAVAALLNSGTIKVYDGSMPASPATAVTSQTLLATLTFNSTAFGTAVLDVNVGQTGDGTSIEFNTTSFVLGAEIKMTSCTLSMGDGT